MKKPIVIFVVGPTASGKTALAAQLGKHFSSAVISADSMQIYKGMHIASAAPDDNEMLGVPHKMLEFLPYDKAFTVADYVNMARTEIDSLLLSGITPVVAGGTGLYINALADNVQFLKIDTDYKLRARLEDEFEKKGGAEMLSRLSRIDKVAADKLNPKDRRRIIRALEIYETTGLTKTKQNELSKTEPPVFEPVMIGLNFSSRDMLYERINLIKNGLLDEAYNAFLKNIKSGAAQAIGHKEFFGYFRGEETLDEATDKLKRSTRRYAKRQLTWFNRDNRISWIYVDKTPDVFSRAIKIMEGKVNKNA